MSLYEYCHLTNIVLAGCRSAIDVRAAEDFINEAIRSNHIVKCDEVLREDVMNDPAVIRLPNEVYPPKVRLVQCGTVSKEPCCGT